MEGRGSTLREDRRERRQPPSWPLRSRFLRWRKRRLSKAGEAS